MTAMVRALLTRELLQILEEEGALERLAERSSLVSRLVSEVDGAREEWLPMEDHVALVDLVHEELGPEPLRRGAYRSGAGQVEGAQMPAHLEELADAFVREPTHWVDVMPWVWRLVTRSCGTLHRGETEEGRAVYSFVGLPDYCVASEGLHRRIEGGFLSVVHRAAESGTARVQGVGVKGALRVELRWDARALRALT